MSKFVDLVKEFHTVVQGVDTAKVIDGVQEVVDILDKVNESNPTGSRYGIDKVLDGLRFGLNILETIVAKKAVESATASTASTGSTTE